MTKNLEISMEGMNPYESPREISFSEEMTVSQRRLIPFNAFEKIVIGIGYIGISYGAAVPLVIDIYCMHNNLPHPAFSKFNPYAVGIGLLSLGIFSSSFIISLKNKI